MLIFTVKLPRRRYILGGLLAAALLVCSFLLPDSRAGAVEVSAHAGRVAVRTEADRLEYLSGLGWKVKETPLAVEELLIPEEFNENYADYLALQRAQGFDLTPYAGKRVKRYTYEITNYPTGEQGVQLSILVYKNAVIGGEVLSPEIGGFLHGLSMPSLGDRAG